MKKGKSLVALMIVGMLLVSTITVFGAEEAGAALTAEDVNEFLDPVIEEQMEEKNLPNLTISVVHQGETLFVKGYGRQNIEQDLPVDPEKTMFRIGSTTKLFTWTAVMQLVEEGLLDLDADVNEYLDFTIPRTLEHPKSVNSKPITLRHLMSHTPGFEDYMTEVFTLKEDEHLPLSEEMQENRPARVFHPGDVRAYSNYGASLAGYIVERVSGTAYEDYIEQEIFEPLEMNYSTVKQPVEPELEEYLSSSYRWVDGEFQPAAFEYVSEPAGSISSSAGDMAKFMLSYLPGPPDTERVLEEGTLEKILTEEFTHHEALQGTAHGFLKAEYNNLETFHHPGGMMLYDTALYLIPSEDLGFFISHSGGNYLVNKEIFQAFMDQYFPVTEKVAAVPSTNGEPKGYTYSGEYYQNRRSFTNADALLSLLFGTINIAEADDGTLLVQHMGTTHEFLEVENGVFQNISEEPSSEIYGDFQTLVFGTDSMGKTMLMADGPMSYSRAAWYEGTNTTLFLLLFSVVTILGSFLFWTVKGGIGLIRKKSTGTEEASVLIWGKRIAYLQGLLAFIFFGSFLLNGEPDPVYGLPVQAFTAPSPILAMLDRVVPFLMILVTFVVVKFAIAAWVKGHKRILSRIHYSLFATASVMLIWVFYYWNLI